MKEKDDLTYQNLWYAMKAGLSGKLIPVNAYVKKKISNQYSNLPPYNTRKEQSTLHLKQARKKNKNVSMEINKVENRKIQKNQ